MIIVSGWLRIGPEDRDAYLVASRRVVETARATPGCIDFCLSADLIDEARINVFEHWESVEAVEAFRGSGPSDDQAAAIVGADVRQHRVTESIHLT